MVLAWSRKSYLGPVEIMYIYDDGPIETVECIWGEGREGGRGGTEKLTEVDAPGVGSMKQKS